MNMKLLYDQHRLAAWGNKHGFGEGYKGNVISVRRLCSAEGIRVPNKISSIVLLFSDGAANAEPDILI